MPAVAVRRGERVQEFSEAAPGAVYVSPAEELDRVRVHEAIPERGSAGGIRLSPGDLRPQLAQQVEERGVLGPDRGADAVPEADAERGTLPGG